MASSFINTLTIRNFKAYGELKLSLKAGINILYGVNGTGKTSLLEAINIAAGSFFIRLSGLEKREIELSDIRLVAKNDMPYPQHQFPVEIEAEGEVLGESITWKRTLNSISGGITIINAKDMIKMSEKASNIVQEAIHEALPIIAYFSTQRLFTQRKDSEKKIIGRLMGYYNALNATNTRKFIQAWFKDTEFEQYQKQQSNKNFINDSLESIKALVLEHFEDWERLYYYEPEADTRLEKGLFIVHKDGRIIPETLLSDGYRNFLWLLIEIAWRCQILNPFLGRKAFDLTKGIVTIDEIDLHLHPQWQQKIGSILVKAFPNIQFVITSHSPIILSAIKDANIILLDKDKIVPNLHLYGLKPSYILPVFMETQERLPWLKSIIDEYFVLINEGNGKSDKALMLRKQLETDLSSNDTLFAEADALIDFLAY